MRIRKIGNTWHYSGTVRGERLRGSCKTTQKEIAEAYAAEIERRAWQGSLYGPETVVTFENAAILYLKAGKPERFIWKLIDYWGSTTLDQIKPGHIRQAAIELYPGTSGATRNRQVIVPTQAIINHAADQDLCSPIRVKRFPVETKERKPVTWEWVQSFCEHASPHLKALCLFMFCTGARISEALRVTWNDVDLESRRILIKQTKIGAERWAHLPGPLFDAVASLNHRDGKLFKYSSRDTAKDPWRKACERAGIEPLSYHSCRHGFATAMLQGGIDPVTVAKMGGWKSAQHVFATYGHAMDDPTVTDVVTGKPQPRPKISKPKTA